MPVLIGLFLVVFITATAQSSPDVVIVAPVDPSIAAQRIGTAPGNLSELRAALLPASEKAAADLGSFRLEST